MNAFIRRQHSARRPGRSSLGFTLIEIMIVVAIIGILLAIAAWNYPILLANIKKKACIASMRTIYGASQLALMENPTVDNLTVKFLVDKGYLKKKPVCPNLGHDHNNGFYSIIDNVSKPLDVVCVITQGGEAHGSLRKILNMDAAPSGGGGSSGDNGGSGE